MAEYRRRLPHLQPDGAVLFVTWRLSGSEPAKREFVVYPTEGHAFLAYDRSLDHGATGPMWLRDPQIADLVAQAILIGERERKFYELCAWVVMPNHVHMLMAPSVDVPTLMRWLKGSTARAANKILGPTGQPFWQDESFDHYLRQANQIRRTAAYIERNPVSAGSVSSPEQWFWSSAVRAGATACPTSYAC